MNIPLQVCDQLDIPLHVVPLTTEYWNHVVQDSIAAMRRGDTPNPDILCNSRVKFGAFLDHLQEHYGGKFDRVASGHYARVLRQSRANESPCSATDVSISGSISYGSGRGNSGGIVIGSSWQS